MAMVGTVVMSAPRANDLHGFLAKANLERYHYRLEHELKLDSVSRLRELNDFSDLVQMGMTKKEIGNLKKQLKRDDHPSGTFSLLRNKSKPVKSISADAQVPPSAGRTAQPATTLNFGNRFEPETIGKCSSCEDQSGGNRAKRDSVCNKCQAPAKTNSSGTHVKRGALKRSMSAATDHVPSCHPLNRVHSTAHPSCMNGQRLALWRDERSESEFSKRLSLRIDDPRLRMPSGKTDKTDSKAASAMTDVLTVLAGPPPFPRPEASNPPTLTDRSPLIEMDKPPLGTSFDNVAATDSGSISRNSSGTGLPESGKGESAQTVQKLPTAVARHPEGKRRKWFPQLKVKIPEEHNARLSSKLNIKKLSAAEERKIDEALELAGTFARLGTTEHFTSTPRTPGASSKESRESLSSSTESPTSHFRFGSLFKMRKEEKKSFVEELASHLTDPSDLLTPDALDAYEKLVLKSGLDEEDSSRSRTPKQSARQAHRLSLRMKFSRHVHTNRSSLSESDKSAVQERKKQSETSPGHGRSIRFGSTGRTLKNLSGEQNLFEWFDKSPLNSTKPEANPPRPKSLQSNFSVESTINRFPLAMPSQTPPSRLPKDSGLSKAESVRRTPPPPPQAVEFCPPPAVPPRVPLRQSTVNAKPRQRHYPLPSGSTDKKRSYSEGTGTNFPDGARLNLPRRDARSTSTDDGNSSSSEPQSPTGSKQLNCTHGSNDSVFEHRSPGLATVASGVAGCLGQQRSVSVKNVKVNVEQLGFSDKNDPFWVKNATFDMSECHSESDLLREALTPIPGRYETSDCISYEDLMEFALENRANDVCDEIRVMRKMFSNEVPVSDCMDSLVETSWDIHSAVKLIKLKQLLNTGLGTQERCKEALMAFNWNVDEAASFLLASSSE